MAIKVNLLLVLALVLNVHALHAQGAGADLLAQSPDGKTVKLIWFIKKWNSNITGFDIKRKEGLHDWQKLNTEPILPELSIKKKLSIVEADKTEEGRIKAKLYELLTDNNMRELPSNEYLQRLNSDENAVKEIAVMIAGDYDLALMNGFAYVDHTVTKKVEYQYGLFIQGTDIMLGSVTWNYGQIPDLNVIREITSRSVIGKNGVQMLWNVDANRMKEGDIAGFNIYRDGIRLNSIPIAVMPGNREQSTFSWTDRSANSTVPILYSISAQSLFGIEGVIRSYHYNPADHPNGYEKAVVTDITSKGYYFKEGIGIQWTFPAGAEKFIKGFYVEKDNMPEGYKQVSVLLDPGTRSFTDTTLSQASGYIRFQIVALYNDLTRSAGVEHLYHYFPQQKPPMPQNVTGTTGTADKKLSVNISWDAPISGDSITDHYRVYLFDADRNLLHTLSDKPVYKNAFSYSPERGTYGKMRFCVAALNKNETEGPLSDTISVNVPDISMQVPAITTAVADPARKKIMIQWRYEHSGDIKGFRIYDGDKLIANENTLAGTSREYIINQFERGATYHFTMCAVRDNNIVSDYSNVTMVRVPDEQ